MAAAETAAKIYHGTRVLLDNSSSVNQETALLVRLIEIEEAVGYGSSCASSPSICL